MIVPLLYVTLAVWRGHLSQEETVGATEGGEEEVEAAGQGRAAQGCLLVCPKAKLVTRWI